MKVFLFEKEISKPTFTKFFIAGYDIANRLRLNYKGQPNEKYLKRQDEVVNICKSINITIKKPLFGKFVLPLDVGNINYILEKLGATERLSFVIGYISYFIEKNLRDHVYMQKSLIEHFILTNGWCGREISIIYDREITSKVIPGGVNGETPYTTLCLNNEKLDFNEKANLFFDAMITRRDLLTNNRQEEIWSEINGWSM